MDTVFGIVYDGGVILAADQSNARSILLYQTNLDKITPLTSHSAMGVSGPNCDMVHFTEYIAKNMKLYEISHDGTTLSMKAQANFARNELAMALRRGPFQVNLLLGGWDKSAGASLYFMDYLAALQKINYGCQGYASMFCLSIMDKDYKEGLSKEAALAIIDKCIHELHTRFLISQKNFIIKTIEETGIAVHSFGSDPADN